MSYWDLLPQELVQHIHFHCWQLQLQEVHASMKKWVDWRTTGAWLIRNKSGIWLRPQQMLDSRVGWGREWTHGVARDVLSQNVSLKHRTLVRNVPMQHGANIFMNWRYVYKEGIKDCQPLTKGQAELDRLQEYRYVFGE